MPFYNIFNEWYAAQTSKKIHAVWQSKADNGKRISSTVPYGYVRDADDKEKWLIDEPAAAVVRKIYELCLAGRGPSQIARQLENERVLVPSAYYESVGRKHSQKVPLNPYNWIRQRLWASWKTDNTPDVPSTSKAPPSVTRFTRLFITPLTNSRLFPICRSRSSARKYG